MALKHVMMETPLQMMGVALFAQYKLVLHVYFLGALARLSIDVEIM